MNVNERLQVALLKRRTIISLYGDVTPKGYIVKILQLYR